MPGEVPHGERVLLVEGPDDKHVAIHLAHSSQDMPDFLVIDKGGISNLLRSIPLEIRVEGRVAVGILVDANDDLRSRWQAVTDRLRPAGIQLPASPSPGGTVIEFDGKPRVGVWLMPDNESPGELEDFFAMMIPPGDPVWPLSKAYIDDIPEEFRRFAQGKIPRAKVHAWLAARERPRPMGSAIAAGDLDTNAANSLGFLEWLRKLFR